MTARGVRRCGAGVVAMLLCGGTVLPAAAPVFSLEVGPSIAGGMDKKIQTKGATVAVRARFCDDLATVEMTGTAEGLVDGVRRSTPLTLTRLGTPGVFAVLVSGISSDRIPRGHWVLNITGTCRAPLATASTIVPLRADVAGGFIREKVESFVGPASASDVERALLAPGRPMIAPR